jgi:pyruvate kinase
MRLNHIRKNHFRKKGKTKWRKRKEPCIFFAHVYDKTMENLKIWGTLGPACMTEEILQSMLQSGMSGMRLNLNHGSLLEKKEWLDLYKQVQNDLHVQKELMMDLKGSSLRLADLQTRTLQIHDELEIDELPLPSVLLPFLKEGQKMLIDDGNLILQVKNGKLIVLQGGLLQPHKSVYLPGCALELPVLHEEDVQNLANAKACGITAIMQPFVRSAKDVQALKKEMAKFDLHLPVYAKIENAIGLANAEEIIQEADVIVIARGDLANAVGIENIALAQHQIEKICRRLHKPYMVVTQMLASMNEKPAPTRAEVSDIFHAVYNGASHIMLTNETAAGKYPAQAMSVFVNVAKSAQKARQEDQL